jgi:hypothetical protein
MLNTPILFIIFNRLDYAKKVFAQIKKVKPKQLFIAADGPRASHPNDVEQCLKTRKIIDKIDWNCDVKTLFRDENVGCAKGVSGAITWFFEHVEEGIILEDDCVPDLSFFPFCALMLEKYRHTEGVFQISGLNYLLNNNEKKNNSYYFSAHNPIWAWATWKRAWQKFELKLGDLEAIEPILYERLEHKEYVNWILKTYDDVVESRVNSWFYVWNYHFNFNKGLAISPKINLVKNIGYEGTHFSQRYWVQDMRIVPFSLNNFKHPVQIIQNKEFDEISFQNLLASKTTLFHRLYNKYVRTKIKFKKIFFYGTT